MGVPVLSTHLLATTKVKMGQMYQQRLASEDVSSPEIRKHTTMWIPPLQNCWHLEMHSDRSRELITGWLLHLWGMRGEEGIILPELNISKLTSITNHLGLRQHLDGVSDGDWTIPLLSWGVAGCGNPGEMREISSLLVCSHIARKKYLKLSNSCRKYV